MLQVISLLVENKPGALLRVTGLLGEGVASNARHDPQAKAIGEWLGSRKVDVPEALL